MVKGSIRLENGLPSSFLGLLAGLSSSLAVGCRPQFLAMWDFSDHPHAVAASLPKVSQVKRERQEHLRKATVYCIISPQKYCAVISATFYLSPKTNPNTALEVPTPNTA